MEFHTFLNGISSKVIALAWVEFELSYLVAAVHRLVSTSRSHLPWEFYNFPLIGILILLFAIYIYINKVCLILVIENL